MLLLVTASRKALLVATAAVALFGVACSGAADDRPGYSGSDDSFVLEATPTSAGCDSGQVKSCTIWLGQHGDLSNCVSGVDVCSAGEWSGCIDETTMAESPELYAALTE